MINYILRCLGFMFLMIIFSIILIIISYYLIQNGVLDEGNARFIRGVLSGIIIGAFVMNEVKKIK